MKKIVIIDHFSQTPDEPGNNRFIYLAEMLCNAGYEVEIITTDFSHKAKKTRTISSDQLEKLPYKYTMLPEPGYPKNVCIKRFLSHYVFGRHLKKYLQSMDVPDLVYIAVPSLDVGTAASWYCGKKKIPLIVDIQDIWPEAFKLVFHVPILSDIIFAPMTWQAEKFYKQADRIIAVSEIYKQRGIRKNKKDRKGLCVYLGTDLKTFDYNSHKFQVEKDRDEIWIVYVGTLGSSYNVDLIIDALDLLHDDIREKIVFKIFGDGPYMSKLKRHARSCKARIDFMERMEYSRMSAYLIHSDIAVNPIIRGAAQSIINKHADYAAAGLPVINTQECEEYRNLIEKYHCGINCTVDSVEETGKAINTLAQNIKLRVEMGRNSRKMAEELFDRSHTYGEIIHGIEILAGRS